MPSAPIDLPSLRELRRIGSEGGWLWLWRGANGRIQLQGSRTRRAPAGVAAEDSVALLLSLLAQAYGARAAAQAQRTQRLHEGRLGPISAARALAAARQAEDCFALSAGVNLGLAMQFSAEHIGRGFLACCLRAGLDPHSLPLERRRALDEALALKLAAEPGLALEPLSSWLEALLRRPLH
jgi:hypothetical protein